MIEKPGSLWRERLASPLTWHYSGFAVLLVLVIALAVRFALDWAAISAHTRGVLEDRQIQYRALRIETEPLRGMDKRIDKTRGQIADFYARRVPANYSTILTQIGSLDVASGVRLSRVQYAPRPPGSNLPEIVMDAGLTGEYPQIMKFITSLERDKIFFVIRGMNLTGQQGGLVNLRLQVSTWLRPADAAASGLPQVPEQSSAVSPAAPAAQKGRPQ